MTVSDDRGVCSVAMNVLGVRRGRPQAPPGLVLIELHGSRTLSIPLTPDQAHLLAHALRGDCTPNSETCDLVEDLLALLDGRVTAIRLAAGNDGGITAELAVEHSLGSRTIAAGVGDAALLARRQGLPIAVPAVLLPAPGSARNGPMLIKEFQRFLDQVSPEQFAR